MGRDRGKMEQNAIPLKLNLGCGDKRMAGFVGVDAYGYPDVVHDLNTFPYPWDDNSVDEIQMHHALEHIPNWWGAFVECARILKPGGKFEIRVPDESSKTALTYRDHYHVFSLASFHGVQGYDSGTNYWAKTEEGGIPLKLYSYNQVPYKEYEWMTHWPFSRLLRFCADHMRNFIHEQRFIFIKIGGDDEL